MKKKKSISQIFNLWYLKFKIKKKPKTFETFG